jgi:hypothetical protein
LSIGFPESVFEKLKLEFVVEDFEGYSCCNNKVVFDKTEYQNWCFDKINNLPKFRDDISNNQQIIDTIKNYPLATKTPIEVFEWIVNLQIKINK